MTAPVLTRELPQLLRVEDVALRLSVCTRTVRALVRDGSLVVYRVGRAVRIDTASVEAYLCRHRVAVPQPVPRSPDLPTSEGRTSTGAGASGTAAAASSAARASASTRRMLSRRNDASPPSSPEGALDPWAILRPSRRRSPTP
jgi:excisionase family DNA binding protein